MNLYVFSSFEQRVTAMGAPTVAPSIKTSTIAQGMVGIAWTVMGIPQGIAVNVAETTSTRGL